MVAFLLIIQGISLASHVTVFTESGELSYQLWNAITMASESASADTDAVLVIIPELPDKRRQFWDCSLPFALYPPFMDRMPPGLVPSFRSACFPDNWIALYGPTLALATSGESGPIHVGPGTPSGQPLRPACSTTPISPQRGTGNRVDR